MGKSTIYKVESNGGDTDKTFSSYRDSMKFYGTLNGDKMLSGIDFNGKRHSIIWSGKCKVR